MVGKCNSMVQKLGRSIASSELKLPCLKRAVGIDSFKRLRAGLDQARQLKEDVLDELEDRKKGENIDDTTVQSLTDMCSKVAEHISAIQEAFKAAEASPEPPSEKMKVEPQRELESPEEATE